LIGFGHQWNPVRVFICSGRSARTTHCWAIFASSSLDACDVLVDDRLVDERPKGFGGLQLGTIGRQMNKREKMEIKQVPETERAEVRQILREQGLDPALTETVTAASSPTSSPGFTGPGHTRA
jgi:hypothetical protein